jgi:alkylated DNA repair dioxygenase AlkB
MRSTPHARQGALFADRSLPTGYVYHPDFLTPADEAELLAVIRALPLQEALYRTFTAKRRIVSFGAGYDFTANAPTAAPPLPASLQELRARAAAWAGRAAGDLSQCTVAEYSEGTQLGWHRDVPTFGIVIGISLASPCRMRFRPYPHVKGRRDPSPAIILEPRSIYRLEDEARWRWQHAISPTPALRYSITFRTMRRDPSEASPSSETREHSA